jgi:uncharacterized membrane protein
MLEQILKHQSSGLSRRRAIEILSTEANRNWYDDWYLAVLLVLYGVVVSSYGDEALIVFLCLATCIAAASYRTNRKSAMIAKSVMALLDSGDEVLGSDSDGGQNSATQSTASPSSGL